MKKLTFAIISIILISLLHSCKSTKTNDEKNANVNLDDISFVGKWLEIEDNLFKRVTNLTEGANSLVLTLDGKTIRTTNCSDLIECSFKGDWWSLRMGHFSSQYENSENGMQVIERFEYNNSKDIIKRVDYEELPLLSQSDFIGKWELTAQQKDSNQIVYSKCSDIGCSDFDLILKEDGTGKIFKINNKKQKIPFELIWWLGDNGDYIDTQFSNSITDLVNIEGFSIIVDTEPTQIKRTRFDEFK